VQEVYWLGQVKNNYDSVKRQALYTATRYESTKKLSG
jgi:hypothetical protein